MKFNLIFFFANNKKPDFDKIDEYLRDRNEIKVLDLEENRKYFYEHPHTGVKAELVYLAKFADENITKPYNFPGFTQSPFSFWIEIKRPTFYALELMPFVTEFVQNFELYIFDPQTQTHKQPAIHTTADLIASWEEQNSKLITNLQSKKFNNLTYIPRKQSNSWWKYMFQLENFRNNTPVDVVFPDMMILMDNKTKKLVRTVTWVDFLPIAIPQCENIAIIETKGVFSSRFSDLGVYHLSDILQNFGNLFEDVMILDTKFKIIRDESIEEAADLVHEKLKNINSQKSRKFTFISANNFVDFSA